MKINYSATNALFLGFTILFIVGCNPDYNTIGADLISTDQFDTNRSTFPVYVELDTLTDIQSDRLSLVHFGTFDFPQFGRSSANITTQLNPGPFNFGALSQDNEALAAEDNAYIDEEEQIVEVLLEIPFLVNRNDADRDGVIDAFDVDSSSTESDSDGDGLSDLTESTQGTDPLNQDSDNDGILDSEDDDNSTYDSGTVRYQVDSIIGNKNATFNLKISEITYFLSTLDPNNNFESSTRFYSSQDFYAQGFQGAVLHDASYSLNLDEIKKYYAEDDPETEDVDETTQVESRLSPRIQVPLDPSFFQEKILDLEGNEVLTTASNFNDFIKGINIRMENPSDDLYMMLNMQGALIRIKYTHKQYNDNGTPDDYNDFSIDQKVREFTLSMGGININHVSNEPLQSSELLNIAETIPLKGGMGTRAIIKLFDKDDSTQLLEDFRSNELLINEANLIFYIDPSYVENWTPEDRIAERLYLYNIDTNAPLIDYFNDQSTSVEDALLNKTTYSGVLVYKDGIPDHYKFGITSHVSNLIRSDNETLSNNVGLGLVVISNVNEISNRKAFLSMTEEIQYPNGAFYNPFGTVLIGAEPREELFDKRLKLELIYTDFQN